MVFTFFSSNWSARYKVKVWFDGWIDPNPSAPVTNTTDTPDNSTVNSTEPVTNTTLPEEVYDPALNFTDIDNGDFVDFDIISGNGDSKKGKGSDKKVTYILVGCILGLVVIISVLVAYCCA
jgi:hypothetical protein